ncbi:MAG: 3-carboxyethylcatechol 2,3-dioxygenase [Acidimicrobiaceae bacterium]|nr:3-carboxyethylcatechol 2,3-dioxygenase [Acidimicrobiaceae bacterium]
MTSTVVRAVGASHSTLMNTQGSAPGHEEREKRFRAGLSEAAETLAAEGVDLAVVIGPNHFRGLWLDLMPAFTLGVGEVIGSGDSGTLAGPLPSDPQAALSLCEHLVESGFDVAFSNRLQVDHGITQAAELLLGGLAVPVVPLLVNVFAPPLPMLGRCLELGAALGQAITALAGGRRVAVIASGGLSHQLPWPDWRRPASEDERFMVEAWGAGREHWRDYEARRRELVVAAPARIVPDFDEEALDRFCAGTLAAFAGRDAEVLERGGNGASELRNWLVASAAASHRPGRRLAYEQLPEWLTGMGVAMSDGPSGPQREEHRAT